MKIITTYVFKCERQYSNGMWWCARFMINQWEQARPSVGDWYALISPFGCAFVYVIWIHLNNSFGLMKNAQNYTKHSMKMECSVLMAMPLADTTHDRVNVSLMHSLSLSSPPFYQCVCFSMDTIFTQTISLCGVLYFDALYCVVYVLSDRECACWRSQGYCCKNILTCTFT